MQPWRLSADCSSGFFTQFLPLFCSSHMSISSPLCCRCHKRPHTKSHGYCSKCRKEYRKLNPPKRYPYKRKTPFPPMCGKCKLRPHRKGNAWCQICANEANRKWRKAHGGSWKALTKENRKRAVVRRYVNTRVQRGHMKKLPCAICGETKVHAHHHKGYSKKHALDVVWLCRPHHLEAERKLTVDARSS